MMLRPVAENDLLVGPIVPVGKKNRFSKKSTLKLVSTEFLAPAYSSAVTLMRSLDSSMDSSVHSSINAISVL